MLQGPFFLFLLVSTMKILLIIADPGSDTVNSTAELEAQDKQQDNPLLYHHTPLTLLLGTLGERIKAKTHWEGIGMTCEPCS